MYIVKSASTVTHAFILFLVEVFDQKLVLIHTFANLYYACYFAAFHVILCHSNHVMKRFVLPTKTTTNCNCTTFSRNFTIDALERTT